ncbi:MAG: class I SAM-dependent methyltransferase [Saprospiraceae bacterium]
MEKTPAAAPQQADRMRQYYRVQAQLYEATRWSFLFGRRELQYLMRLSTHNTQTLLEVGCGTGYNLQKLAAQHPDMRLVGVDVSPDMLRVAAEKTAPFGGRVRLIESLYAPGVDLDLGAQPSVVLLSYCLTMINPGWESVLDRALDDLPPGGKIAVVDFHDSPVGAFRWWMRQNHVRMDGHLLPALRQRFRPVFARVRPAYFGLWRYFLFVGKKM